VVLHLYDMCVCNYLVLSIRIMIFFCYVPCSTLIFYFGLQFASILCKIKQFNFDPVPSRMSHDSSVTEDIHNLIIVTIRPLCFIIV
jgi:hypothetical protein